MNKQDQDINLKKAVFAGGCFWCVQDEFQQIPEGIIDVVSGYAGGKGEDAEYKKVAAGQTGHREVVQVVYDPEKLAYEDLVRYFFTIHDPTDAGGSFADRGYHYTSAIYYEDKAEEAIAQKGN